MSDPFIDDWKKELKVLLDRVRTEPSADLSETRDRIVVLQNLIAGRTKLAHA